MCDSKLERAVLRFNACWADLYNTSPVPSTPEDIEAWYARHNYHYSTVRFIPNTGWVDRLNGKMSDADGLRQHRLNALINEAGQVQMLARPHFDTVDYW